MIETYSFGISEWSLNDVRATTWTEHIAICINSMLANTSLKPILYWIGDMNHPLVCILQKYNIEVRKSTEKYTKYCDISDERKYQIDRSTILKFEIIEDNDSQVLLGDLDILFLKQPQISMMGPLMAGPRAYQTDKTLNAGFMYVDPYMFQLKNKTILNFLEKLKYGICFEQNVLAKSYENDWIAFPTGIEHRPWWPKPKELPSVVHFHGPKIAQMRNLLKTPPANPNETTKWFYENEESCLFFFNLAVKYRNYPLPLMEEFDKLKL